MENPYQSPELIKQLTHIVVSEFGYLHPMELVKKQLQYCETKHISIDYAPDMFRRFMQHDYREPDISSAYLRSFIGALIQATGDKAVTFVNFIEDVAIVDNEIHVFFKKPAPWLEQTAKWFFHSSNIDRQPLQLYNDKTIIFSNKVSHI